MINKVDEFLRDLRNNHNSSPPSMKKKEGK